MATRWRDITSGNEAKPSRYQAEIAVMSVAKVVIEIVSKARCYFGVWQWRSVVEALKQSQR